MKTLAKVTIIFVLPSMFLITGTSAQTKATGHITAEIVESVSTTSRAVNSFDLKSNMRSPNGYGQLNPDSEELNLAEVIITSGSNVGCNFVISPVQLSNARGNDFTIETFLTPSDQENVRTANGNQILTITGRANALKSGASGLFTGSYSVVVVYD